MNVRANQPSTESPDAEFGRCRKQLATLRRCQALLEATILAAGHLIETDDLEQGIVGFLAQLGQAMEADRVYILETRVDVAAGSSVRLWHAWAAPGVALQEDVLVPLALIETIFPNWVEKLEANQAIHSHVRDLSDATQKVLSAQNIQSLVVVPIFVENDWWGLINFDCCQAERDWSPTELDALKMAAGIVGAALRHRRMEKARREADERIRNRAQRLAALHDISRTIGSTLDVDKVLCLTLERSCEIFQAPMGTAHMADLIADVAVQRTTVGLSQAEAARTAEVPLEASLIGQVIITGRPVFIERGARSVMGVGEGIVAEAAAFIPLVIGEHVLGTLNLIFDAPRVFGDEDRTLLTSIGRQVGMALANARLFQEILTAEKETRRRAEQLAALHEIGQAINSSLEPTAVYTCIVERAAGLLDCQVATLFLWDRTSREAIGVASFVDPATGPADASRQAADATGQRLNLDQHPIVKEMLDTRASVTVADAEYDSRAFPERRAQLGIRALLVVPLVSRGEITGFLYLVDQSGPRQWQRGEVTLAGQLAAQAAIAIENARLFAAEQKARQTAEALQESARIVNASLDLDQALNLLLEQLARLIPYDSAAVFLPKGEQLYVAAGRGFPDMDVVMQLTVRANDNALLRQAINTGRPVFLTDAQKDQRFQGWANTEYVRSWIGAPLTVGTELVGVMTVDSRRPGTYDQESTHLVQALADQTAVAIHKARLMGDLRRANRALRRLDELKDQFIQNVAHELRTPLTLVRGNLELLSWEGLDAETQQQALHTATTHADNLVRLVEGITTLQDLTTKGPTPHPMNLAELAETALQLARQDALQADIELRTDYPSDLPVWSGDSIRLLQALYQLLDNAIKFSPNGGTVTLRLRHKQDRNELQIEVEDQGIGVPLEEQQSIFDLFYQADGTTTRRFGGAGLGLAIVQRVVQAHGGRVWVESSQNQDVIAPGPGSKFIIRLPLATE